MRCWVGEVVSSLTGPRSEKFGINGSLGRGLAVHVHQAVERAGSIVFRCNLTGSPADRWRDIPAWMFDRAVCTVMRVEATPRVDIGALNALCKLLQVAQNISALPVSRAALSPHDSHSGGLDGPQADGSATRSVLPPKRLHDRAGSSVAISAAAMSDNRRPTKFFTTVCRKLSDLWRWADGFGQLCVEPCASRQKRCGIDDHAFKPGRDRLFAGRVAARRTCRTPIAVAIWSASPIAAGFAGNDPQCRVSTRSKIEISPARASIGPFDVVPR